MPFVYPPISRQPLFIRDHFLDGGSVGHVGIRLGAQTAAALGVLLGEDVALKGMGTFNLAGLGEIKSLFGTAMGLQFGHDSISFHIVAANRPWVYDVISPSASRPWELWASQPFWLQSSFSA